MIATAERVRPGQNRFLASPEAAQQSRVTPSEAVRTPADWDTFFHDADEWMPSADVILVHWMMASSVRALARRRPDSVIVWCQWGRDVVSAVPSVREQQFLPRTKAYLASTRLQSQLRSFPWFRQTGTEAPTQSGLVQLEPFIRWMIEIGATRDALKRLMGWRRTSIAPAWCRQIAPEIDLYCGMDSPELFIQALPGFSAEWLSEFKYYSLATAVGDVKSEMRGPDILIANRATPSCNHLDALELIRKSGHREGRIILPLNYGSRAYGEAIAHRATEQFGSRVVAIHDWMNITEYTSLIVGCGTVIMNSCRGQGLGSSALGLYKGARVFVRPESPHYEFYRREGLQVFSSGNPEHVSLIGQDLDDTARQNNRQRIAAMWSPEAVDRRTREILEAAERRWRAKQARQRALEPINLTRDEYHE